jgi:hypothetical protein
MLFCSAMICLGRQCSFRAPQPAALNRVIDTVGPIQGHHGPRGDIQDQKHSVVLQSAPIAADDVIVAEFRLRLAEHRGRFADPGTRAS